MLDRQLLDILCGRHDCWEQAQIFPVENGAIQMNRFCVTGEIALVCHWWASYWREVERGILGLNPK